MKNKEIKQAEVLFRLPELQIHSIWKKVIDWFRHVKVVYWVIGLVSLLALFLFLRPDFVWNYVWPRIMAQGTLVMLVLIFCAVAVSLIWKRGQRIDVWIFMVFNMCGTRPLWVDWMMLGLTQLGSSLFAFALAFIVFMEVDRYLAYEIVLGTLTLWLVVELMKMLIRRTRPYIKLKNIRIIGARAGGHSFPSGHTSQSFYMATLLLQYYQGGIPEAFALYALALLVGITRIYVGMHYPRDVLGGAVLGTAWGLLGVIVNTYIR